jgi:hypothetical protein
LLPPDKGPAMSTAIRQGVMRPGPNKRSRGRNNGNNPHHNRPRMPHRIQTFDSNGPNVKIRGNAYQVFERYVALAREAAASGDRIAAENLYQHAEHYFRVMNANGEVNLPGAPRPTAAAGVDMGGTQGEQPESDETSAQTLSPSSTVDEQPSGF